MAKELYLKMRDNVNKYSLLTDYGNIYLRICVTIGVIIVILGLQVYGFYQYIDPKITEANRFLSMLTNEVSTNNQVNRTLRELDSVQRSSEDEVFRKRVTQTYKVFIEEFTDSPRSAVEAFANIVAGFEAGPTSIEQAAMTALKMETDKLEQIYTDHYSELTGVIENPPVYLQPMATYIKGKGLYLDTARLNHAVYLSVIGDRSMANTILDDLKQNLQEQGNLLSRVYYAQARMLFDIFQSENGFEYYKQSIYSLQQSLKSNPDYDMAKLFLDYVLSLPVGEAEMKDAPWREEGTGAAEGEKGVIAPNNTAF